jgi:flagellar hook-length control protein FliK
MPPMPATLSVLQVADTTPATAPDSAKPLDLQHSEWVAKLSQEIVSAHESGQPLAFRLAPQFLGELKVGLTETAQGLVIELQPSSREAAAIIAREEPRLVEELRQRGVQVSEATLQFGASNDGRNSRNGANLRPFQPLQLSDPARVQDQNQHHTRPLGRFA